MISKRLILKALRDNLTHVCLEIGENFKDKRETSPLLADEVAIFDDLLLNDDRSIGLADNSSDMQMGIYQVSIYIPRTFQSNSEWSGLAISDRIQAGFAKGKELCEDGQLTRIKNSKTNELDPVETHFIWAVSIKFSVIN
jgi:hypothetical protein